MQSYVDTKVNNYVLTIVHPLGPFVTIVTITVSRDNSTQVGRRVGNNSVLIIKTDEHD